MRNLILFLIKSATFFEFLLLETVAFLLIFSNTGYQSNVVLSSCNHMVAGIYRTTDKVTDYFSLNKKNSILADENTRLQTEVELLKKELLVYKSQSDSMVVIEKEYDFIPAKVIHNTVHNLQNYLVLDKGSKDGITSEMGVVNESGVVGIVKTVSKHFSTVIPILNTQLKISGRLNGNSFGSLMWDGKDYRFGKFEDIPRHVEIKINDSIFTSGFSAIFPAGFLLGTVEKSELGQNDANHDIKVRLGCNFKAVNFVKIIRYENKDELKSMEQNIKN